MAMGKLSERTYQEDEEIGCRTCEAGTVFNVPGIHMETIRIPAATAKQTNIPTLAQFSEPGSPDLAESRSMSAPPSQGRLGSSGCCCGVVEKFITTNV
jgi:hypothetical protein